MNVSQETGGNEKPPVHSIHQKLASMKDAIWKRRPILAEIMEKRGKKNLYQYTIDFMDVNPAPRLDSRKHELIAGVHTLVSQRLGTGVADGVARQLGKYPLVSTTDHHGPIDHPFFVNANIISALPYETVQDPDVRYLVVLSFASVSVNNASAYPRGILFNGGINGSANLIRLPFLPDKVKMGVVYNMRGYTQEDFERALKELDRRVQQGEITSERGQGVRDIIEDHFSIPEVLKIPDLKSQISFINHRLWPNLFHAQRIQAGSSSLTLSDMRIPELVYIEIETLVADLLLKHHLFNDTSPIYRLLFDPAVRARSRRHFNNIPGAFSEEQGWGTHFFWGVDKRLRRIRMTEVQGTLHAERDLEDIQMTPENVAESLKKRDIFPSMLLCYLIVSQYYGMKCLGGFSQVNDLTLTKEAWQRFLREIGDHAEADAVEPVQTKELGGDGLVLSYLPTATGNLVPATGIDMILEEGDTTFREYAALSNRVTLEEMMHPMIPEIYTVLYSAEQRDQNLLSVTPEQILRGTGLDQKLARIAQGQSLPAHMHAVILKE